MKPYRFFIRCVIALAFFSALAPGCSKTTPPDTVNPGSGNDGGNGNGSGNGSGGNQAAVFSLQASGSQCMNATLAGTYRQQVALDTSNTVTIQVNVTKTGTWSLSTLVVDGMSFSGAGSFSATGTQAIVLRGSGTPIQAGTFRFAVTAGSTSCDFEITVTGNSITYIRGIKSIYFAFDSNLNPNGYQSNDEVYGSTALSLSGLTTQGDTVVAKLVNAGKGTLSGFDDSYSYLAVFTFSNVNNYGAATNLGNVDTAGKLQIWIYRKDGSDIVPASGGKPAIKTIIQVPGKFTNDPAYSGKICLHYPYLNPWYYVDAAFMENLFSRTNWKLGLFNRRD